MTNPLKDRIVWVLLGVLAALTLLELLWFPHSHPEFPWHDVAGYTVLIVLAAALSVGWVAKAWLAPLLQVPEDEDE